MKPIKSLLSGLFIIGGLVALASFIQAQVASTPVQGGTASLTATNINWSTASDLEVMLQAIEMTTPLPATDAPDGGNFYTVQHAGEWPPLPGNIYGLPFWDLGGGFYLLDDRDFDYAAFAQQNAALHEMARAMGLENDNETGSSYMIDTNGLWLEITNVVNGLAYLNLRHGTDYVYEVWSKQDLTASNWDIETEVFPGTNQDVMPFTVSELDRTNLFIWARDWTGITSGGNETPEWWFWKYFHTVNLSDTNLDSTGNNTLLYDYQNGVDPNAIQFSLQFTNTDLNTTIAYGTITILSGTPFYEAILINDTNEADANWQPYSSTNVIVPLNSGNGTYSVLVGLRGLPADAQQTWMGTQLRLNNVAPVLTVTNPTASTVSVPMIQLQGYVSASLSKLTYDVSNAAGIFTNQQGYWLSAFYDTNLLAFTTNSFQCYDIRLTNGLNQITLHATDVAGNTATTNVSYTLDYSGDHTAPVLSFIWPTNGTSIGGSNFTLQAQVDDATATVIASIVDTNGDTNIVTALVERTGVVWVNNLPLNAGTNTVTLAATDAAGNMSTTNFAVVKSAVNLTINPVSSDQLNQPLVTVTGTVTPGENVWVNGVQASVDGSGNWTANNVPVNSSGTANLTAGAGADSNDIASTQTLNWEQASQVLATSYQENTSDEVAGEYCQEYSSESIARTVRWTLGVGGYIAQHSEDATWGSCYAYVDLATNWNGNAMDGISCVGDYSESLNPAWQYCSVNQSFTFDLGNGDCAGFNYATYTLTRTAETKIELVAGKHSQNATQQLVLLKTSAAEYPSFDVDFWGPWPAWSPWTPFNGGGTNLLPASALRILEQTPVASATNANVGELIVSMQPGAVQDITPTITYPLNQNHYSFNVQAYDVNLEIIDANSGTDLTLQTNTVIVGQQMSLRCQLSLTNQDMTNFPLANFQWTVPGYAISNYVTTINSGIVYTNFPTGNSNAMFFWVDSGIKQVQCSATVSGKPATATATFNVLSPTATLTPVLTTNQPPISVGISGNIGDTVTLHPGSHDSAAVTFLGIVTAPTNGAGVLAYTQLAAPNRHIIATNNIAEKFTSNGTNMLDGQWGVQYGGEETAIDSGGIRSCISSDTPEQGVDGLKYVSANDHFQTYLMYKYGGDSGNSVWVTLQTFNWSWSGTATNVNGIWSLSNATLTNTASTNSTVLPQWDDYAQDLQWITE